MTALVFERESLERRRHRLLGGWRDILDDIRTLCRSLAELPDECECGHGAAHLKGTCPCCNHIAVERVPACDDCEEQLERLRDGIDLLTVDTFRFFPVVKEILNRTAAHDLEKRGSEIEWHIAELVRMFADLVVAAERFKADCRASHLKTLKELALRLQHEAVTFEHDV
jgi:hypothetical protein